MWPVAVPNQLFNFTHTLLKKFSWRGYIKNEANAHCNNREKKLTSWLRLLKSKLWIINYLYYVARTFSTRNHLLSNSNE